QHRAAVQYRFDQVAEGRRGDLREGQHPVVVRVADGDRTVEVQDAGLLRLGVDDRVRVAADALDRDVAVPVQIDAVLQVKREEQQPPVDLSSVHGAGRTVDGREGDCGRQ